MGNERITYTAAEYSKTKTESPFRIDVEAYTNFLLVGDPKGLSIVDAGCGDGLYARKLVDLGAVHVLGIDCAADFIKMAREKNEGYEGRIDYVEAFIQDTEGTDARDIVLGSYALSYPKNREEAVAYCRAIASQLKPGGKFIGFNNNPFDVVPGEKFSKYGFRKVIESTEEGSKIVYWVHGMTDPIVNYYLRPETYEAAFKEAGFTSFEWVRVKLDPQQEDNPYWEEFFAEEPPFIAMVAVK